MASSAGQHPADRVRWDHDRGVGVELMAFAERRARVEVFDRSTESGVMTMVFVVEWLKGDRVVRKEAMLGAGIDDVLTTARSDVEEPTQWSGSTPDRIRILDTSCGEAIVHEIGAPGG